MKTVTFVRELKKIIDRSGDFVTDTIDMRELKKTAKKQGKDIIFVAGESSDEVFLLEVLKV